MPREPAKAHEPPALDGQGRLDGEQLGHVPSSS
jgi:hypothetical protein